MKENKHIIDPGCSWDINAMEKALRMQKQIVFPTAIIQDPQKAVSFARVLNDNGISMIEVLLRTPCAIAALRQIKQAFPEMLVGAGTVKSCEQIESAVEAGADFIVTAGTNPTTAKCCQEKKIYHIPGVITPTEIEWCMERGYRILKYYPAAYFGGTEAIEEIGNTYPEVCFMTTGGISFENLGQYTSCDKVVAAGGTFIANSQMIEAADWNTIAGNCRTAIQIANKL